MNELPTALSFDALHPVVVHFPVALLLAVPLLLAIGWWRRQRDGGPWLTAGLLLAGLGTLALFVAVETGEASAARVRLPLGGELLLLRHQELGEALRWAFLGLALGQGALLYLPHRRGRALSPAAAGGFYALLLIGYLGACGWLLHSAHLGGRLVHELGVRAWAAPSS